MAKKKSIAVFGGSFNPPGIHHRRIVEALSQMVDQVIVVPCGPRPDKRVTNEIAAVHRAAMVDMTFRGLPNVEVDLFDLERDVFTRSHALERHYEDRGEIWHVVGTDLVKGGLKDNSAIQREWENGATFWEDGRFIVFKRRGHTFSEDDLPPQSRLIEFDDIGASEAIRKAVVDGEDYSHFVLPEVEQYIERHNLYRALHPHTTTYIPDNANFMLVYDEAKPEAQQVASQLSPSTSGNPSLIVVIGGDGAMLRAIRQYWRLRIPFYGINVGNLGFLLNSNTSRPRMGVELTLQQLPLLWVEIETPSGELRQELAFNDTWLERATGQLAWVEVKVDGEVRLPKLVADGALISTAAGSASYAFAMGASPLPFDTEALLVVGSNVFRPHAWKSAVLPLSSSVEFTSLEPIHRPMVGYIDGVPLGPARRLSARVSRAAAVELVFEPGHDIAKKLARVQFSDFEA